MLKGILKTRSVDINNLQKIIDPFILVNAFFLIFNNKQIFINTNYFIIFFCNLIILNSNQLYESYRIKNLFYLIPKIFFITCTITLFSIFIHNFQSPFENIDLINYFSISFIYLFLHHFILRKILRIIRSKGYNLRNAIFLGNKISYDLVKRQIDEYPWLGYKISYWFSPNKRDYSDLSCNGGIEDIKRLLESKEIDKLFFCHSSTDEFSFEKILRILGNTCIPVSYMINWDANSLSLKKEYFGEIVSLNIWNPGDSLINEQIKRIFDLIFSILIIIILFPIILIIIFLIRISSKGPIIFSQKRCGYKGDIFLMYKFRTMFFSEKIEKKIIQAKLNDKRVTKVGRFLRKYSLDELPQLINVIKGEMSLVGPRPHAVQQNEYYRQIITGYMQRHSKLPGITGLAQISGARGETKNIELMKKRVKFDIEYNNNWNLSKDFYILLRTFFSVLSGKAY